jgi:signal transduction histidine kinase
VTGERPRGPLGQAGKPLRLEVRVPDDDEYDILVERRDLPGGAELWVGRSVEDIDEREGLIEEVTRWGALIAPPLGLAVGLLMSFAVARRIDAVVRTARSVMGGDLSRRMEVRGSGDDFDHLSATLNLMLDRIEQLIQSVAGVSDQIAHELRTPLTRLRAELDDLADDPEATPSVRARAGAALAEAGRLEETFEALLRIARLEADDGPGAPRTINGEALLRDAMELYLPDAESRGLSLEMRAEPGLRLTGDPSLLFQAVSNLLDNAVKYTPSGGRVRLIGERAGDDVVLSVVDDGPGVDEVHRGRIVDRFYRAPGGGAAAGLGLGLSLVAAVAKLHGGALRFEDARPGLKASLSLPSA